MLFRSLLVTSFAVAQHFAAAAPSARATAATDYAGYFMAHFKQTGGADQEQVYFSYSYNDNPDAMQDLNGGNAVLSSKGIGTSGARDPFVLAKQDGSYVVMATDLNATALNLDFNVASRNGSRSLLFWDSTGSDLASWSGARLVEVGLPTFGMCWAPESIWVPEQNQYLVYWSSKVYADDDPGHNGNPSYDQIWAAYTSDFVTFGTPFEYMSFNDHGLIDLTMHKVGEPSTYVRYWKDEIEYKCRGEVSYNGVFGDWQDIGSNTSYVDASDQNEGPLMFQDNLTPNRWHIWVDYYNSCQGYQPWQTDNVTQPGFTLGSKTGYPACGVLKHGAVVSATQQQIDQLVAAYP